MHTYRRSPLAIRSVDNQQGIALVMTLMFIAVLTIVGSTAVTINSTDLLLGGAFQASQTAFHNADSGVNYVTSQIYLLQVTGRSRENSPIKSTVEVVLQRRTALDYGLFAADRLDLPARGRIYSYDSRPLRGRNPTASTKAVKIAANGMVTAQAGHLDLDIDGDITLGKTPDGEDAYFAFRQSSPDVPLPPVKITTGEDNQINLMPGDALPTDPLDIQEMVDKAQQRMRFKNDNDRVLGLSDYRITHSRYLREGNYYLKELTLGTGKFLTLDARRADINIYVDSIVFEGNAKFDVVTDRGVGKVNIYLGGPASFGSKSALTQPRFKVTGDATTFRIFSRSSEPINFYHTGELKGLIYALHAPVMVHNSSATGYGLLWSDTLDFSTNAAPYTFFIDTALQETFLSKKVDIVSWKELRD